MVSVKPSEIVDIFFNGVYNSTESRVLASTDDTEIIMYDNFGYPEVVVMVDGMPVENFMITEFDTADADIEALYDVYINKNDYVDNDTMEIQNANIEERQFDLESAMAEFMATVMETTVHDVDSRIGDILPQMVEDILLYCYRKYGISPYRPMVLKDSDSDDEYYEEYPYPVMDFD